LRSGLRHGEAHLVELRKGGASPALHQPCAGTASFFDRSYDGAHHQYGYTLANETSYASLTFTYAQLTAALSDPTQDTRWFSGRSPNPSFLHPTTFLGDYSGIAATLQAGSWPCGPKCESP